MAAGNRRFSLSGTSAAVFLAAAVLLAGASSAAEAPVIHVPRADSAKSSCPSLPCIVFVSATNGVVDAETKAPDGDDDLSYWFSCTYDDDGLAVRVVVNDDERCADTCPSNAISCAAWDDDAVEIFIDGEMARLPNSRADGGIHLKHGGEFALVANGAANSDYSGYPNTFRRVDPNKFREEGPASLKSDSTNVWWTGCAVPFPAASGSGGDLSRLTIYAFYIPWAAMGRTNRPDRIGFNISVQDDDGGGRRDHALYWTGNPRRPFCDESAFGTLVFDDAKDDLKGEKK